MTPEQATSPYPGTDHGVASLVPSMDETVLLNIEDDPSIREVIQIGLERAGFDVTAEADGRQDFDPFSERIL